MRIQTPSLSATVIPDASVGRQNALNVLNADLTVRRGQLVLDEGHEQATFLFGRLGLREGRESEEEKQKCCENAHQNACPMPT